MPLFRNSNGTLTKVNKQAISKERELQMLMEQNLSETLGMHFLATEYPTNEGRIDTLAVDESGSPVIIEYKRNRNQNVIGQGIWYLDWLMAQKKSFLNV